MFFVSQHCGYHKCGFNLINVSIYCHNKDKYHSLRLMHRIGCAVTQSQTCILKLEFIVRHSTFRSLLQIHCCL